MYLFNFYLIIFKNRVSKSVRFEGIVGERILQRYARKQSYPQYAFKYYKGVKLMTRTNFNNKRALTIIKRFKLSLVQRFRC